MKIVVVYIYPLNGAEGHLECGLKFLDTYHRYPPVLDHETYIISNGQAPTDETRFLFSSLPNCYVVEHSGVGRDIGAFQFAARTVPCDLMVFFGGNTYLRREGWLKRMVEVWQQKGDTLYGAMGNRGLLHANVHPHIRTSGWWMSPSLLNQYPIQVTDTGKHGPRYEFEHGRTGLTSWIHAQGKLAWVVTFEGAYTLHQNDHIPGGFHIGNQENLLVGDRMSAPPYYHCH